MVGVSQSLPGSLSFSHSLSSVLALIPEYCVTSIGADDVFYDTFLPMWVVRLILLLHISRSLCLHLLTLVYLFCFPFFSFFVIHLLIPVRSQVSSSREASLKPPQRARRSLQPWTDAHRFNLPSLNHNNLGRSVLHSFISVQIEQRSSLLLITHFLLPNSAHTVFFFLIAFGSQFSQQKF